METNYKYLIIGAGLAGGSAVDGIREVDKTGSILLIGAEGQVPYNRPPLSKQLWWGKKQVSDIFLHDVDYYKNKVVDVVGGVWAVSIDSDRRKVTCADGTSYGFEKLLIATGGVPRKLDIPGGNLDGLYYYRDLEDFKSLRPHIAEGVSVLVIGGGFIGSELAAAFNINKAEVTLILKEKTLLQHIFPAALGQAIHDDYIRRGVQIIAEDMPATIQKHGDHFLTRTQAGREIAARVVVIGVGIEPEKTLATTAGLALGNGIIVDEYLRTSNPNIFAAGDNAFFPYQALGRSMRVEHWDNALNQGKFAGRNMAGANEQYTYMPYFFSDLFDFGFEAVGVVSSKLDTYCDWQKENDTGVIYYLENDVVKGVMNCNVWDKVNAARELIRSGKKVTRDQLRGAIQTEKVTMGG